MRQVPVEVQMRTIAMNFWASTEHQLRYKKDKAITPEMHARLKKCADIMADADYQMQKLAEEIHFWYDVRQKTGEFKQRIMKEEKK